MSSSPSVVAEWLPMARSRRLLTVDELAILLGVSSGAVRRAVHQKAMPHYRFGRYYRFDPDEVLDWSRASNYVD